MFPEAETAVNFSCAQRKTVHAVSCRVMYAEEGSKLATSFLKEIILCTDEAKCSRVADMSVRFYWNPGSFAFVQSNHKRATVLMNSMQRC